MAKRSKQKKTKRKKRSKRPTRSATEWVGGQLLSPFFVSEGDPFRPQLTLWLELPADVIVWHALADPSEAPIPFAETLRAAMRSPAIGPPRTPARVRVADARLAAELHVALPELEVVVAPTPELHAVVAAFAESDDPQNYAPRSYLEAGRVAPEAMAELFVAADLLYGLAPWRRAGGDQLVRLDVPALGVEGACVSLIGALGESALSVASNFRVNDEAACRSVTLFHTSRV